MATIPSKPDIETATPRNEGASSPWASRPVGGQSRNDDAAPAHRDALHALLAFSALHEQVRRRKALASQHPGFDAVAPGAHLTEFDASELFVLDEVLQLVAERAVAITGADGLAIALAENNEIVLRAAAGSIRPDVGARIDRDSAFSGAAFRNAQVVQCDDTETDDRVNLEACRELGARSMVAVPLCGRHRVIGLLEAFSSLPFGFNDSDVRNLSLLAELVLGALKPEDEDRFAESAAVAETKLTDQGVAPAEPVEIPVLAIPAAPVLSEVSRAQIPPICSEPTGMTAVEIPPAKDDDDSVLDVADDIAATPGVPGLTEDSGLQAQSESPLAASEPEYFQPQPATESRRFRPAFAIIALVLLVGTAFAIGVWWKLRSSRQDLQALVNAKPTAAQSAPAPPKTMAAAPVDAAKSADQTADSSTEADSDESPAPPQELAKLPSVSGVRHWTSPDSSTVVLDLADQVQYEAHRLSGPDRIYFDLHDTQLASDLLNKAFEIGDSYLSRVRVAQPVAGVTRIVLETKPNTDFSVSLEPNPYRLTISVRKAGTNPSSAVNLFPGADAPKTAMAIVVPPPTKEDLQLRARLPKMRIVVDAGHGGWDLGTVGRRGLLEKDLVLEISQRLGKLLESRLGAEIVYTRQDDNYIPLDERAQIANQSQADLFVSIHANYSDLPSARGVETYYTNFFTAPGTRETGSKDASVRNVSAPTLSPAELHDRIEQSRRLAASVQHSLYNSLSSQNAGLRDRGIKEAGFVVLTESAMPGILAEVSFVSSPTDEQKLRSDGYREQIAEALYKGIAHYAASSKNVKLASAAN